MGEVGVLTDGRSHCATLVAPGSCSRIVGWNTGLGPCNGRTDGLTTTGVGKKMGGMMLTGTVGPAAADGRLGCRAAVGSGKREIVGSTVIAASVGLTTTGMGRKMGGMMLTGSIGLAAADGISATKSEGMSKTGCRAAGAGEREIVGLAVIMASAGD